MEFVRRHGGAVRCRPRRHLFRRGVRKPSLRCSGHRSVGRPPPGGWQYGRQGRSIRIAGSALFANVTTASADGAVNVMHDSFSPLGGGMVMANMMLFSGLSLSSRRSHAVPLQSIITRISCINFAACPECSSRRVQSSFELAFYLPFILRGSPPSRFYMPQWAHYRHGPGPKQWVRGAEGNRHPIWKGQTTWHRLNLKSFGNLASLPCDFCRDHLLFIGMDYRRNWVVRDQTGPCGGLFVDRSEALRLSRPKQPPMIRRASPKPTAECWPHDLVKGQP